MPTKIEATKQAARVLRGGYFTGPSGIRQRCPHCSEWLETPHVMGRPDHKGLKLLLVDHIRYDH